MAPFWYADAYKSNWSSFAGGNWLFNFPFCVLYIFSDMTGCTSSIMHMLVISIDRYLGIAKPLEQRNRSKSVVGLKIMGVWIISLAISSPVVFASLHDPINALPTPCLCEMGNEFIMVYGSIAAFFLPLAVMGVMMFLTARLLRKQAKWSQGKREGGGPRSRTVIKRHHPVTPPQVPQTRYFPVKSEPKKRWGNFSNMVHDFMTLNQNRIFWPRTAGTTCFYPTVAKRV